MAKNPKLSMAALSAQADVIATLLNGGTVEIRTGTQPASPDAAATGTLLAVLAFANPAAAAPASNGVVTFATMVPEDQVLDTGTAAWFRAKTSGGTAVLDGTVGLTAGNNHDMLLSTVTLTPSFAIVVTSFTHTVPQA